MKYLVHEDTVFRLTEHPHAGERGELGVAPGETILQGQHMPGSAFFEDGNWFTLDKEDFPQIVEALE